MTDEQKAAYVSAQAAMLTAKIAGMQAANLQHTVSDGAPKYTEEDFERAANESGCGHNTITALFYDYF